MLKNGFISVALLLVALVASPLAQAEAQRLDQGHIDAFNVTSDGGALTLDLKEDVTGSHVRRDPADVELVVGADSFTEETANVPEIGTAGYMLPQTQRADLIWPGWDTQEARDVGAVDLEFVEVSGPGEIYLFQTGSFGSFEPVLKDGSPRLATGSVIAQDHPAHVHANWLFTEPGTYQMRVVANGGGSSSNEATYTWVVGDGEAKPAAAADTDKSSATPTSKAAASKEATSKEAAPKASTAAKSATSQAATSTTAAAANAGGGPAQPGALSSEGTRPDALAETGTTVMTVPFAILGLGVAVFGAAMCVLDTALRRKLLALAGVGK